MLPSAQWKPEGQACMRRLRLIKWSIPSLPALNSATLGSPEDLYFHRNITGSRKLNFIDIALKRQKYCSDPAQREDLCSSTRVALGQ